MLSVEEAYTGIFENGLHIEACSVETFKDVENKQLFE